MNKAKSQVYSSVELPTSVPGVGYSLKHRNAVELLIDYYCTKAVNKKDGNGQVFTNQDLKIMRNRAKCHDMDKLLLGLSYPQLTADYFHRIFNGHHEESMLESNQKTKYDWIEMILDMESAKYTKKDKQGGGAFDYASKCKQYIMPYLMPYFILLGLNKQDTGIVNEIKDAVNRKYYETDLIEAILNYIHTTHLHILDGVSRIDDKGYQQAYGTSAPFKLPLVVHQRPNEMCNMSQSIMSREMIHGAVQFQLFDMDKICNISSESTRGINKQALNVIKTLGVNGLQR